MMLRGAPSLPTHFSVTRDGRGPGQQISAGVQTWNPQEAQKWEKKRARQLYTGQGLALVSSIDWPMARQFLRLSLLSLSFTHAHTLFHIHPHIHIHVYI